MATRARRSARSRLSFRDNPLLQQYILEGVRPTGKELGRGSYGSVIEVKHQHTICAAKELHEILLDPGNRGVEDFVTKYERECQLIASVSHPNLTQFLGLCFLGEAHLPLLVMERLEMSLDELLAGALNMSLLLKISLLHDTCSGLVYLHSRQPPIVHRDLTARNVLISSSMTAKIADFGCSRIIDIQSGQLIRTMSKVPGTLVYMPPEALDDTHRYGPSLDVFSFGHLSLYAIIQESPDNLLSFTYPDPRNREQIIARSEVERRQSYMDTLKTQVTQSHPALFDLIKQCLHNAPERRPSSVEILRRIKKVKEEVEGATANISKQQELDKNQIIKELKAQNSQLEAQNEQLEVELKKLRVNSTYQKQLPIANKSFKDKLKITYPLQLDWKSGPDMPLGMSSCVHSVEVEGTLYVGGGQTAKEEDEYVVMAFNTTTSRWHTLPPYRAKFFGMTTINNKLVLVGGWNDVHNVDQIGVWQTDMNDWTYPFPPMNTARSAPSATSYNHWLVVAGGCHGIKSLSSVEVLNVDNYQWSTRPSIPTPWHQMRSTMIGDTWYLMGGWHNESFIPDVLSVSLKALLSCSSSDSSSVWSKLASLNCTFSIPHSLGGSLLAFGGWDGTNKKCFSTIQHYIPDINTWAQAGSIPYRIQNCTCVSTSDKLYVMGGHDGSCCVTSTYFCTF